MNILRCYSYEESLYNIKDEVFIYSFFKFSVIYSILYVDIPVTICFIICEGRYFIHLNYHVFTPESKETKCKMALSNFENLGNSYKEVTCPMAGYQSQLKGARFTTKMRYWFVLEIRPLTYNLQMSE